MVADASVARSGSITDYSAFTIRLDEVFRFDRSDALVFRLTLRSKTQRETHYQPGSFAVRVGDHVFTQALSDASGVIPAAGDATVFFVVQGNPDGQRNELSPHNNFTVLVNPM